MSLQIIVKNSSVSGKEPTGAQLASGEIALNYHADGPFLTCKDTAGVVRRITGVWVNATAPSTPTPGELWLDISLSPPQLKTYQDSTNNWVPATTVYAASTTVAGVVELSTDAETQTGTDTNRAVTPASLQSKISDSTSTTSSTTIASSTAVKAAKDAADTAATTANAALPKSGGTITGNLEIGTTGSLTFEGSTADGFETQLTVVDPTADRTITLPNVSGTVVTTGDTGSVTSTMIADGTITNTDINASAGIVDTKLATISTADKVSLSALNIDGGTDIGAALADADLFIVDDGGAGTNRKAAVTRITDYTFGKVTGDVTITSNGTASIKTSISLAGSPTTSTQTQGTNNTTIATTAFVATAVSAAQQGLNYKPSCRVATTANITLSGTQTIDGVAVVASDRVLVKNQTNATQNGIYVVAAGSWTRATDFDESADVTYGAFVYIAEGTSNASASYVLTTTGTITFGVTAITFSQYSGAAQITAGNGLTKTGNTIDLVTANSGRIVVNADNIDLASGIATPGTYQSVTVDTYGRVTGGTNPTTLSGFGITDAATSTHVHGNISNSGAIGSTANLPVITTTGGVLTTGTFGTTANTFCQGNDSRLSDARNTPNSITFNNGGGGGASGSTFNGSGALTVSYNTVGAPSTTGANASGSWGISITGSSASCTGNAATATTLANSRNIALGGDLSGLASFNGSTDITITAVVSDDSHNHSISTLSDEHRLFNNMGDNKTTRTDFNASYEYGWRYVSGTTNSPGTNSATEYYSLYTGLGNDFAAANFGMQVAFPRNVTTPYISIRYREAGVWGGWQKINAGYADTAGSANAVAWTNVSSKPTTISGYGITDAPTLSGSNALTGANTFTNATGQTFRQSATQDGILLRGRAGGTASYNVEIVPTTLSASRTLTAPNVDGTIVTTGDTGSVTNTMLAGSIANNKLANSSITVNSSSTALGGSVTLYAGTTTLQTASSNQGLTGISSIALPGATSGTITVTPAATAGTTAITIPATSGTLVTTGDTGTVTNTMLAGSISNNKLTNSSITINSASTALGGTVTLYAGTTALQTSSGNQGLTGISSIALPGATSGTITVTPAATAGTTAITIPATSGTLVTTGDNGTVTSTMIVNGTITDTDINASAGIAHSKLASITAGSVLLGSATNVPTATALSGDVTINSSGVTAIGSGVIVNADVSASAAIDGSKINPNFGSQNVVTTGNTGLGTTSPNAPMEARGASTVDTDITYGIFSGGSSTQPSLRIGGNNTTAGSIGSTINRYSFIRSQDSIGTGRSILLQTGTNTRMTVREDGNIGINTTAPSTTLHVVGTTSLLPAQGITSQAIAFNHDYGIFADNTGAGSALNRLWIDGPSQGEVVIGPRSGASVLNDIRLRANTVNVGPNQYDANATLYVSPAYSDTLAVIARFEQFNAAGTDRAYLDIGADAANNLIRYTSTGTSAGGHSWYSAANERLRLTAAGAFNLTGAGSAGLSGGAVFFSNAAPASSLVVSSGGQVLLGTDTSRSNSSGEAELQIEGTSSAASSLAIHRNTTTSTNDAPAYLVLSRSGATNMGSTAVVANNNRLGEIRFVGYNGTSANLAARIFCEVDGAAIGGGTSDMPGRIVFATTPDGSGVSTEVMRLTSDNYMRFAASTGGIQFNGNSTAATALDDYEEGSWPLEWYDASSAGNKSSTSFTGQYIKVGSLVNCWAFGINIDTTGLTAGNVMYFTLPFTAANKTGIRSTGSVTFHTVTYTGTYINTSVAASATRGAFVVTASGGANTNLLVSAFSNAVSDYAFSFTYHAA